MALVIKHWFASDTANGDGDFIYLHGRQGGLVSWILSFFKISPDTELHISDDLVRFNQSSLAGTKNSVLPINKVVSAYYGYTKPWKTALAITVFFFALGMQAGVFLLLALLGPVYYVLNKSLSIAVTDQAGDAYDFAFKRSVLEGQNITEVEAQEVIEIIRRLIERRTAA